jgi:hypothetical protein
MERHMASNDPDFEQEAADVIGSYMNPPQNAAVFCVDEKTAIRALDRWHARLPLSPGRAERHGFEYKRHGTLSLYAAFDTKTGTVFGKLSGRSRPQDHEVHTEIQRGSQAGEVEAQRSVQANCCRMNAKRLNVTVH